MAGVSNPGVEHDAKTRGIILHIVEQIKSQGVFDRFRRDCLEELDSKEPYRQLKQRVESHVATFLSKQTFSANLPKNQLRTSLRANINQSEVLSKGVDRLLEQVLVEKSSSFYKEIENLVEEHLISTGHYTRYDRDKSQRSDAQPRPELTKLSDKEVEDIIKEETNKLLEASADERSQESDRGSYADTPPPGTSGEVTEVETLIGVTNDRESAKPSQGLKTNLEANSTPDSSTGKLGVGMPTSEESGLKGETEVIRQIDESMVSKAQNVDDLSQTDGSKDQESSLQETNALISETENPTSAKIAKEAGEIIQKPVVIAEGSTATALTAHESSLKVIDSPDEPFTSNQGTSALQGEDVTMSEIPKSDDSEPASETKQHTDATVVQAPISQHDITKGGALKVDLPTVQIGIERKQSKVETKKENIAVEQLSPPTTEINQAKISIPRADNAEVVKPKAEKVKPEVPKLGEAKPEIFQPEIVKPEVGKPKVDKTRRPKENMPKVVKPEVSKPKVNKVLSKPAVGKAKIIKPEVSKVELFSPDVIKAKVVKAPKPEEKVKPNTKTEKQRSKKSIKPKTKEQISMPKLFSTDEETDEDLEIPPAKISPNKSKKSKLEISEVDNADLSDSDITVSSVHTSDLSSLEDSMSDMEYEDYQELVLKKGNGKETAAGGCTKNGVESGASGIETDKKKTNQGKLDSGGGKTENVDIKKKKSVESGADVKEDIKEKASKEISEEERSGESGAVVSEDTDSKSSNVMSTRIDTKEKNKEKMLHESDATSPKVNDESSEGVEKSESKETKPDHSDISSDEEQNKKNDEKDSQQKTEARRSDSTESEAKTASQVKEQANLHPSKSNPALFKPIEPADLQVFSEPAASRRGGPAFARATDGASDADNETTIEDSDGGNIKLGKRKHSRRASTSQESESSNDTTTPIEEQKEPQAQRRSARVASKDRTRSADEKHDHSQGNAQKSEEGEGDSARKLRRMRYSQEKTHEVRTSRSKEERRNEKVEKRTSRLASDSTDSDMKPCKRPKRTVKPTRCYSPSENS